MPKPPRKPEEILERLEWTVIRRLDGLLQGEHRTLFKGGGLDLADLREYEYLDDVRTIDWNVTARLQTPYVREYNEDREITAWFLCDLTPSIDFGSAEKEKRTLLIDFVAVFARMLSRSGNRFGALLYDGAAIRIVPVRGGKRNVLALVDELTAQPKLDRSPPTNLAYLLETASKVMRRRSLVFLISDFYTSPGWEKPLGIIRQRHETLAIRLFDPLETELPDLGIIVLSDAESGDRVQVDTGSRAFRKRYKKIAAERATLLRMAFAQAGVDALELSTNEDIVDSIMRFVMIRKYKGDQRAIGGRVR